MQNAIKDRTAYFIFRDIPAVVHLGKNLREVSELVVSTVTGILQVRGNLLGILDFEKDELVPGATCSRERAVSPGAGTPSWWPVDNPLFRKAWKSSPLSPPILMT